MDLDFVCIECDVIAETSPDLTVALYSALHNIEWEFRSLSCIVNSGSCAYCDRYNDCPYRIIFAQELSSDPEVIRTHQKPSLPFSLYISNTNNLMSSVTVGLVVIGIAVNYAGFFHNALIRVVQTAVCKVLTSGTFRLLTYCLDYQGVRQEIKHNAPTDAMILLSGKYIMQNTVHSESVKLSLLSPLRLLRNGSTLNHFDFALFLRSQMRRCSSLCAYYGNKEMNLDFVSLSHAAQSVVFLEDEINNNNSKSFRSSVRGGLTGVFQCHGLVEPMFSLLLLGSYFNSGKGATYGGGYYRIEVL